MVDKKREKPNVGDKIFLSRPEYLGGTFWVEVSRVGRQYFYVKRKDDRYAKELKIPLDKWEEGSSMGGELSAYESRQEYEDIQEVFSIVSEIRRFFRWENEGNALSLGELREIRAILDRER